MSNFLNFNLCSAARFGTALHIHHHDGGIVVELCGFGLSVGSAPLDKLPVFIFHIAVSQPLKTEVCAVEIVTFAPFMAFTPHSVFWKNLFYP